MEDVKKDKWDASYKNKDNFVFYPHEEVIRFVSKYIRKRVGDKNYIDKKDFEKNPKVLDFGCGIGRHVRLCDEFGLDAYGFDLSDEAILRAKEISRERESLSNKFLVADITQLPYHDRFFDFMLSHGVLDSMPFEIAKKGINELHRTINDNGIIYFDVIDVEDMSFSADSFEQVVTSDHENGTVQTFFDKNRILELLQNKFNILELYKVKKEDQLGNAVMSRYHVIVQKVS